MISFFNGDDGIFAELNSIELKQPIRLLFSGKTGLNSDVRLTNPGSSRKAVLILRWFDWIVLGTQQRLRISLAVRDSHIDLLLSVKALGQEIFLPNEFFLSKNL